MAVGWMGVYLFPVVQALVVVLQWGLTLGFAGVVFGVCVDDVAGEDFLPEGKAARRSCGGGGVSCQCLVLTSPRKGRWSSFALENGRREHTSVQTIARRHVQ